MKDKKQDVNVLEELSKAADEFRKWVVDFGDKLSKVLDDIQNSKKEEDTWKMKCPFENGNEYYLLKSSGDFQKMEWTNHLFDELSLIQGNIFTTEEAVNLEVKRRKLLTRFRAFRDECNGDWNPDWKSHLDSKYYISFVGKAKLTIFYTGTTNNFQLFGFFKNQADCERAIELFGDEIKELFVEGDA
ncbi:MULTISPECIES: hypothetical protein [unclassified Granulicatella]|uniref:hypothetical protein n=1 Tax=unclassified Granulicatella TaxID=2630493 RepID=UPI00066BFEA2|nr:MULTISPECIES: hypothetical protein [unclassified Granulicatella]